MNVLAIHCWDTRPKLSWRANAPIVKHNFEVLQRPLPPDWSLKHFILINNVREAPEVRRLANSLQRGYGAEIHWWPRALDNRRGAHLVVFNHVLRHAYDLLGNHEYDRVFTLAQDFLLVNHTGDHFLAVLETLRDHNAHPRNKKLGRYGQEDHYDYIGHTIPPGSRSRFRHNVALYYDTCKLKAVLGSISQARCPMENELARRGEHCLYLLPHPQVCFTSYMHVGTLRKTEALLRCAHDPSHLDDIWRVRLT